MRAAGCYGASLVVLGGPRPERLSRCPTDTQKAWRHLPHILCEDVFDAIPYDMDCLTCKHNTYAGIMTDWVSCCHPVKIAKTPKPDVGDPAWVNMMTADVATCRLPRDSCPTYERVNR